MVNRLCIKSLVALILISWAGWFLYLSSDANGIQLGIESFRQQFVAHGDMQLKRSLQIEEGIQTGLDSNCSGGILMYNEYCVISPYGKEVENTSRVGSVTLCAQGTVDFLHHVLVLCRRWSAPISVAVYSPGEDYDEARVLVHLLRQCDSCVRYWVNWHFFFPLQTKVSSAFQYEAIPDCNFITQPKLRRKWRSRPYPINVARNVARRLANTPFLFSNDIELYPSLDIPIKFERMLQTQDVGNKNQVWVLPVFEVYHYVRAPLLKSQLRALFVTGAAISFHLYRCKECHQIPGLARWMSNREKGAISEVDECLQPLKVFRTVKRSVHNNLQSWEPFFIGTNDDPEFDIRFTWEGKQNKMQMAYEMCMRDYDFHIADNAFLVHSPGIKKKNDPKEKFREKYLAHNEEIMRTVKKNLKRKYGSSKGCG